jgi:hypothetical protein
LTLPPCRLSLLDRVVNGLELVRVPNDALLDYGEVSENRIEFLTLAAGEFKLYVQNGKEGPPSNAGTLNVPDK